MQGLPRCMFQWNIIRRNNVNDLQSPGKTRQHFGCSSAYLLKSTGQHPWNDLPLWLSTYSMQLSRCLAPAVPPRWLGGSEPSWAGGARAAWALPALPPGWPSPATRPVHLSGVQAWLPWAGAGPAASAPASLRVRPPSWSADAHQAPRALPGGADSAEGGTGRKEKAQGGGRRHAGSPRAPQPRPVGVHLAGLSAALSPWHHPRVAGIPTHSAPRSGTLGSGPQAAPVPPRTPPACGPLDPPSALQPGPASLEPQRAARGHFTQLVHSFPQEVGVGGSGAGWGASEGGKPTCLVRAQPPAQVRARARWP